MPCSSPSPTPAASPQVVAHSPTPRRGSPEPGLVPQLPGWLAAPSPSDVPGAPGGPRLGPPHLPSPVAGFLLQQTAAPGSGWSQPELSAAAGSGAPQWPCLAWAVPGTRMGRGPRGLRDEEGACAPGGGGGATPGGPGGGGRGALTFLHARAEGPPRLVLAVFEQSFPDWIWEGEKGVRVGVQGGGPGPGGDRDPPAPTRRQPPCSPQPLPLACPAAAAKPGNASRKKEIRFPTEPRKLLNRNRKSCGLV